MRTPPAHPPGALLTPSWCALAALQGGVWRFRATSWRFYASRLTPPSLRPLKPSRVNLAPTGEPAPRPLVGV
jgi:hypothetical protein